MDYLTAKKAKLRGLKDKIYDILSLEPGVTESTPTTKMLQQMGISMTKAVRQSSGGMNNVVLQVQNNATHLVTVKLVDILKEIDAIEEYEENLLLPAPIPEKPKEIEAPKKLPIDVAIDELVEQRLPVRAVKTYVEEKYVRAVFAKYGNDTGLIMLHLRCDKSNVSYLRKKFNLRVRSFIKGGKSEATPRTEESKTEQNRWGVGS